LPATLVLEYIRNGNRSNYQSVSFGKRKALGTLLFAEILENKGRFTDQIMNGVWSICEESYWGVPAHIGSQHAGPGLPDVEDPYVDLFAAETATYLALTDYFAGDKLDAISPLVRQRIRYEVNQRIFTPVMTWTHGWMAPNAAGRRPNNWNPWICSNWLMSALLLEEDEERRVAMIRKILVVIDEFLTPYPEDGGCDEGPGYWNAAAASLFDNLSILELASDGKINVYDDQKIRNMGNFIYKAQISETYFLNFADASPKITPDGFMVYHYGKKIGDRGMMKMGAYYMDPGQLTEGRFHFFRRFFAFSLLDEMTSAEKGLPLPGYVFLPDIQVMMARDVSGESSGFYMAAKGGHNDESHNHNDLGNYVVFYDGAPVLIDVGSGTYTRKTFSSRRYDIWYNTSEYHNVPTINGIAQQPGREFEALDVSSSETSSGVKFGLELRKAYPDEAGIITWKRTFNYKRDRQVILVNKFTLKNAVGLVENLMTNWKPDLSVAGQIVLPVVNESGSAIPMVILYDKKLFEARVEQVSMTEPEDEGVVSRWGDRIYRIQLIAKKIQKTGQYRIVIERNQ
jgi:hypothetical protein